MSHWAYLDLSPPFPQNQFPLCSKHPVSRGQSLFWFFEIGFHLHSPRFLNKLELTVHPQLASNSCKSLGFSLEYWDYKCELPWLILGTLLLRNSLNFHRQRKEGRKLLRTGGSRWIYLFHVERGGDDGSGDICCQCPELFSPILSPFPVCSVYTHNEIVFCLLAHYLIMNNISISIHT